VLAALALLGCAPSEPRPALPTAATFESVDIAGTEGSTTWAVAAARAVLEGQVAHASETAVVHAEGGKTPMEIRADRSTWKLDARVVIFSGNVAVTRGPVMLRCAQLEVRYADPSRVESVVASGGVVVERGQRHASAREAELVGGTGEVRLTGDPRLQEGPNTLVGSTITLWLDDERADCTGADGAPCRLTVDGSALPGAR
jgi:lipopolysaccharide export system protein LptA